MCAVRVKAWHHTSLAVGDLERAVAFYRGAFGYELVFEEKGMSDQIASMTGREGMSCDLAQLRCPFSRHVLELIAFRDPAESSRPPALPTRPGAAHVAFYVADLEAALRTVQSLGAVRLGRITEFSEGRSVYCREPSGSFFEMEQAWKAQP